MKTVWILLYRVPEPGPPLPPLCVAEVLLRGLLQDLLLPHHVPVLLALEHVHLEDGDGEDIYREYTFNNYDTSG